MRLFSDTSEPDAWADAVFSVSGSEKQSDGMLYHLVSKHGIRRVGLNVWIRDGMEALSWDGEEPVFSAYREGVVIRSQGARSDRFLKALAVKYQYQGIVRSMRLEVPATAIVLEGHDRPTKIKIFFNDGEEDDQNLYAELFLNFDIKRNQIELAEKDPEYRDGVIRSFCESKRV